MSGTTASAPTPEESAQDLAAQRDHGFFGQPRGLLPLFGLELWERFSFLGMQAILALFFASTVHGGFGMSSGSAASVAAGYSTAVYLVSVGGGWIADRVLGSYRSVLWGGVCIACGHYAMAIPTHGSIWIGLALIIVGTGLLKPNVSTMVGKLYTTDDERRDAGFALYYMGINIGAFAGPLIAGWLGQGYGWHWGFSAAAVGMTFGIVQYVAGRRHLAGRREGPESPLPPEVMRRNLRLIAVCTVAVVGLGVGLGLAGVLTLSVGVDVLTAVSVVLPVVYFVWMFRSPQVAGEERGRLRPYLVLWIASVVFNLVLFQSYTVLALLAADHADTSVLGWSFPSTWYNSVMGAAEVLLAPVVAGVWVKLGSRQPHASNKIAMGTVIGGLGYLVMALATQGRTGDWQMAAWWLLVSFVLLGLGDVILETTGLATTTKLAPAAFSSQTMALWFLSLALANGAQAQVVKLYGNISDPLYFALNGGFAVVVGLVVLACAPWLRRTMAPVR